MSGTRVVRGALLRSGDVVIAPDGTAHRLHNVEHFSPAIGVGADVEGFGFLTLGWDAAYELVTAGGES